MRLPRAPRTLRGRVSLLAVAVIAVWLFVLTLAFNLYLERWLHSQSDAALRVRAQAASATVAVDGSGGVHVRESSTDSDLDSDTWIFAAGRAVERPSAPGHALQQFADSLATHGAGYADLEDDARLYVLPVSVGGQDVATVVVAQSTAAEHTAERAALAGSAIVSALLLAVAYPVIRVAVRRALEPMDAMARQAADWSERETSRRFGTHQRYEELSSLAGDLHGLLDRLSAALRHERRLSGSSRTSCGRRSRVSPRKRIFLFRKDIRATETRISRSPQRRDRWTASSTPCSPLRAPRWTVRRGRARLADVLAMLGAGDLAEGDVTVGVDAAVLERILAPLLDNARRYARTAVRVDATRAGSTVHIDVTDDGPGVPDSDARTGLRTGVPRRSGR